MAHEDWEREVEISKKRQLESEGERCDTCRFLDPVVGLQLSGHCHRYPESISKELADWCGEYKKKK